MSIQHPPATRRPDRRSVPRRTLTDLGNAERFVDDHGPDARYCFQWGKWLVWDGTRWMPDTSGLVEAKMKATVRGIYREAADAQDERDRKAMADHAKRSESRSRIGDALWLARSESGVPVLPSELDANPALLNCENGTVDLLTGKLREHRRSDLITKIAPVEYDPEATAPTFDAFLQRILPSEALREFAQRVVGYAASGDVSEEILIILHGTGANGKSTLINIILDALGDYAMQAAPDLLLAKRDSHPTELADLFGARFVASVETDEGRRLSEGLVKQLTGRDPIKARRMREDFWQFEATHTLFLATNHRPEVRGSDHAIWRRIKLVPFEVAIPEAEQDKRLPTKLRDELPGILAWIVRGCLEFQRMGLGEPDEVRTATGDYRADMDVLGVFIEECCVVAPNVSARASHLYAAYKQWCEESGENPESQHRFGRRLAERGFRRDKSGVVTWFGIGLHSHQPDPGPFGKKGPGEESRIDKPNTSDKSNGDGRFGPKSGLNSVGNLRETVMPKKGPEGPEGPDRPDRSAISEYKRHSQEQPKFEQAAPSGRRGSEGKGSGQSGETNLDEPSPSLAGAERPLHGTSVQPENDACHNDAMPGADDDRIHFEGEVFDLAHEFFGGHEGRRGA